eukprot:UN08338
MTSQTAFYNAPIGGTTQTTSSTTIPTINNNTNTINLANNNTSANSTFGNLNYYNGAPLKRHVLQHLVFTPYKDDNVITTCLQTDEQCTTLYSIINETCCVY